MATAESYPTSTDPTPATAPAAHAAPVPPITLEAGAAWELMGTLRKHLEEFDWEDYENDLDSLPALLERGESFCTLLRAMIPFVQAEAARRAQTTEEAAADPLRTLPNTPAALRQRLAVVVVDDGTLGQIPADADMYEYVFGLQRAVADYRLPAGTDVTEESARALYRLGRLADALETAARHTGAHIFKQANANAHAWKLAGLDESDATAGKQEGTE